MFLLFYLYPIFLTCITFSILAFTLIQGCHLYLPKKDSPALIPLAGLICGIALTKLFAICVPLFLMLAITCFAIILQCRNFNLLLLYFVFGIILFAAHTKLYIKQLQALTKPLSQIEAVVISTQNPTGALVYITQVQFKNATFYRYCPCLLQVHFFSPHKLQVGQQLIIQNPHIKKPNDGYLLYLMRNGICASLYTSKQLVGIKQQTLTTFSSYIQTLKDNFYKRLQKKMNPQLFDLVGSIFLGNQEAKKNNVLKPHFDYWGISHFLARSGLHVVLFILFWQWLALFIPAHYVVKKLALLLLILVYSLYSWPSISFVRACSVYFLYSSASILQRQVDFVHLLALVCLISLIINPYHLFFLDFQLSFALAGALGLLGKQR